MNGFEKMAQAAKEYESQGGTRFYRCMLCTHVVSPWDLQDHHGCPKCAGTKVKPTNLSLFEKIGQLLRHPRIWTWPRG
jgi:rubrerythrin